VSRSSSTNASTNAETALSSGSGQRSTNRAHHHKAQSTAASQLPTVPQRWSSASSTALNPSPPSLHGEKPTTRYGAAEGLEERKSSSEIYGGNLAEPVLLKNGL